MTSKPKTHRAALKPYLLALGELALAWSGLQETLGLLFAAVVANNDGRISQAIWQSQNNDRSQRELLRFANEARAWPKDSKANDDIAFLLADIQSLQDKRNDAIHSPYILWYGIQDATGELRFKLEPRTFHGNVRANKLKDKDLLR